MNAPAPGSAEWQCIVTASKVAAIIGVSPWDSPRSMWHKMRGDITEPTNATAAMSRGNYLEAGVVAWWRDQHPEYYDVREQYYATRDDIPWAAATLDGLAIEPNATCAAVEVKTASRMDDWGDPGTDEIPVHYLTQVYWQLAMAPEATRAYVAVLGPFLEFAEYVVERDDAIQDDLIDRCRRFHESLSADVPPPLDDHVATFESYYRTRDAIGKGESVEVPADVAAEFLAAREAEVAAIGRARLADLLLMDAAGPAQYVTAGGARIARQQSNRKRPTLCTTSAALTEGAAA